MVPYINNKPEYYINVWSLILTTDRVLHKCMVPYINNREYYINITYGPLYNKQQSGPLYITTARLLHSGPLY